MARISNCLHCKIEFTYGYSSYGKYCCSDHQYEHKKEVNDQNKKSLWLNGKLPDNSGNRRHIYNWLIESTGNKCSVCNNEGIWNDKPLRLWVDHIDGNPNNNNPDNFRLVCPNCESQSDTFAGRNRGNGRKQHTGSYFS